MADKKAMTKRRVQNVGVKEGTLRVGAKGKSVRRWNAKTARWEKVNVSAAQAAAAMRSTAQSKRVQSAKQAAMRTPGSTSATTPKIETKQKTVKESKAPEGPKLPSKRSVVFGGAGSRSIKSKRSVTTNRPERGKAMQLVTERDGTRRWVTYVKPKKGKK